MRRPKKHVYGMEFDDGGKSNRDKFEIGRQIIKARYAKGWSQEELAAKVGVRQPAIAHYEKGQHVPRFKVMRRLGKALGVPLGYFYSDSVPSRIFGSGLFGLLWVRIVHWWRRRNKSGDRAS